MSFSYSLPAFLYVFVISANGVLGILTSTTVFRGSRRVSNRIFPSRKDRREMTTMKEKSMRDIYGILSKAFNGRMGYTGV